MASEMIGSSAAMIASIDSTPPTEALSFFTAASVTSSLVCDDNMSAMRVENRLFYGV